MPRWSSPGISTKITVASTPVAVPTRSVTAPKCTLSSRGTSAGRKRVSARIAPAAAPNPSSVPPNARSSVVASRSDISLPAVAPSTERSTRSAARLRDWAMVRSDVFVSSMMSNRTHATRSAYSDARTLPVISAASGIMCASHPSAMLPSVRSWAWIARISRPAASRLAPGRRRAATRRKRPHWRLRGPTTNGTQNSCSPIHPKRSGTKSGGMMPTMVTGTPSSPIVLPTIDESAPRRRVQNPWLTMTSRASGASPVEKPGPSSGRRPRSANRPGETSAPLTRSGPALLCQTREAGISPDTESMVWLRSRHAMKATAETTLRSRFRGTLRSKTATSRDGSSYGSGRKSTS